MRALARPKLEHVYDPQIEIDNLIQHRDAVPVDVTRNRNIPALGDFNLPRAETGDAIHATLTKRGLSLSPHTTGIPTNVSNTADYDQTAITPGLKSKVKKMGAFDFDGAIFPDIINAAAPGYWRSCARYYISDHRPLLMQLELQAVQLNV